MISHRCKMMVEKELKKLRLRCVKINLGLIEIFEDITSEQEIKLKINLKQIDLELLDDKRSILVERIKVYSQCKTGKMKTISTVIKIDIET